MFTNAASSLTSGAFYWSSTEDAAINAWFQFFGGQNGGNKFASSLSVRAVRAINY